MHVQPTVIIVMNIHRLLFCFASTLLRQESIVTVKGVPMTDYMENLIKGTMASKAGQVKLAFGFTLPKLCVSLRQPAMDIEVQSD
jgi:hypothetical protein